MARPAQKVHEDVTNSYANDGKESLADRLRPIIGELEREAEERVGKRRVVEQRWLEDLRQFHGCYEDKIVHRLKQAKKSQVFINKTRSKTNAMEARLSDMLFPTDDRNWGIEPTPVPELTLEAEETARKAAEAKQRLAEQPEDPALVQAATEAHQAAEVVQKRMDVARKRARAMQEEIDDQLRGCRYSIQSRDVIRDACRIGTGIMKGPVIGGRSRRSWQYNAQSQVFELGQVEDKRPVYWRVDPWAFFPDFDAHTMEDCESVHERHLLNRKQMRALAKEPGYDRNAIRRLLGEKPQHSSPYWIADLRSITGAYHDSTTDRYHVWEYHGPLEAEKLATLAQIVGDDKLAKDVGLDEVDPLDQLLVNLWFCQGELLKFGIHSLDSGDAIYSVFNLEKDEASIFGFGVPYMMRDSQKTLNAGWRTMLDNAGLASGPQVVINEDVIEPADDEWVLTPRKIWKRKTGAPADAKPFETFDIEMHQTELANIIELSERFIDEETAISTLAEGEQGTHTTQTLGGMSILMNAVNVVFRRIVKNWDDDMTTPNIRRLYDWNMQFSPKEHIKGDFEVDARGTSVLLVREIESGNLMAFLLNFVGHPKLDKFVKKEGLPALRRLVQTMMIPADEVIKSDTEVADDEAKAAQEPAPPNPEVLKAQAQLEGQKLQAQSRERVALIQRETALIELASKQNMEVEKLKAMLFDKKADRDSKERMLVTEAALEARQAEREPKDDKGSGGYIS